MKTASHIACVADGFSRAASKVLAVKPREEWGGSGVSRGFAAKTFDPTRTKPPATKATSHKCEINTVTWSFLPFALCRKRILLNLSNLRSFPSVTTELANKGFNTRNATLKVPNINQDSPIYK